LQEGDDSLPKDTNNQLIPSDVDYVDTWKAMEECVKLGLTKSIGLSNFNSQQIQRVLDTATIKPVVNQVMFPNPQNGSSVFMKIMRSAILNVNISMK
jgi:diketogulonate reductase-like aldo/keto reductase